VLSGQARALLIVKVKQRINRLCVLIGNPGFTNSQELAQRGANEISAQLAALGVGYAFQYVPSSPDYIFLNTTVAGKLYIIDASTGERREIVAGDFAVGKYASLSFDGASVSRAGILLRDELAKKLAHLRGEPKTIQHAMDLLMGLERGEPEVYVLVSRYLEHRPRHTSYTSVGHFPTSAAVFNSETTSLSRFAALCMRHGARRGGYWSQTATPYVDKSTDTVYLLAAPLTKLADTRSGDTVGAREGMSVRRVLSSQNDSGKRNCLFSVSDGTGNRLCVQWITGEHILCAAGPKPADDRDPCWCLGNVFDQGGFLNSAVWVPGGFWGGVLDIVGG